MSPEEIAATATVNAAWIALAGGLVGVAVTVLAGFIGAGIQSRREHKKWVREKQYEATVSMYALIKAFQFNRTKMDRVARDEGMTPESPEVVALVARDDALYDSVAEAMAPLAILGPTPVGIAAAEMQVALEARDRSKAEAAQERLIVAARRSLKVRR
ncbi:hypothetical protein [Microbacterium sufflavum]|uniref:Uncharacterized protein n=1 Tax=Microbacterium sufflavum TaxID=2851649 RepID=A0ABY4IHE1_9MICO|nr:hypothetical protein [Microbacterium sufflavum]UPL12181.1 hypothetical protein KV394_14140 [Microbacterium sufflavum]